VRVLPFVLDIGSHPSRTQFWIESPSQNLYQNMTEQKKRKREHLDDQEVDDLFIDLDKILDHAKTLLKEKKSRANSKFVDKLASQLSDRLRDASDDLEVQPFHKSWGPLTNIEYNVVTYTFERSGSIILKFTDGTGTIWRLHASLKFPDANAEDSDGELLDPNDPCELAVYHTSPRRIAGDPFVPDLRNLLVHLIYQYSTFKPKLASLAIRPVVHRAIR
jgi:hypothetical protein